MAQNTIVLKDGPAVRGHSVASQNLIPKMMSSWLDFEKELLKREVDTVLHRCVTWEWRGVGREGNIAGRYAPWPQTGRSVRLGRSMDGNC